LLCCTYLYGEGKLKRIKTFCTVGTEKKEQGGIKEEVVGM